MFYPYRLKWFKIGCHPALPVVPIKKQTIMCMYILYMCTRAPCNRADMHLLSLCYVFFLHDDPSCHVKDSAVFKLACQHMQLPQDCDKIAHCVGAIGACTHNPPLSSRTIVMRMFVVTLLKARACCCSNIHTLSFTTCGLSDKGPVAT